MKKQNNFYLTECSDPSCLLLFVKEFYCIFIIQDTTHNSINNSNQQFSKQFEIGKDFRDLKESINETRESQNEEKINNIKSFLEQRYKILDIFTIDNNCEITSVQIDLSKSLILINSTDKYLRYNNIKVYFNLLYFN